MWLFVCFFAACEKFPSNPPKEEAPPREIHVEFLANQYVPVLQPVDGLVAKKMNVLTFRFQTRHAHARSLEFFGSVVFEGPPDNQKHDLRFRTDRLDIESIQTGISWNVLQKIRPDTSYTLVRCKLPMNEYAPFEGDQGKIVRVTIEQVSAEDGWGGVFPLNLVE